MAKSAAQVAYEAYARAFPGKASTLAHPWAALPPSVKDAWLAAALALGAKW